MWGGRRGHDDVEDVRPRTYTPTHVSSPAVPGGVTYGQLEDPRDRIESHPMCVSRTVLLTKILHYGGDPQSTTVDPQTGSRRGRFRFRG